MSMPEPETGENASAAVGIDPTGGSADRRTTRRRVPRGVVQAVSLLLTVGTLWYFLRGLDTHALVVTLEDARPGLLAVAVLLNFAGQAIRAAAWRSMLGPAHSVGFRRLLRYEYAAQAASSLSPAKAGEVLRLWMLRREGVPTATSVGLIALKKLLGAIALMVLVLPAPLFVSGLPGWLVWFAAAFAGAMLGLLGLLTAIARGIVRRGEPPRLLAKLTGSLSLLRDTRRTLASFAVIFAGECVDLAAAWFVLDTLNLHEPLAAVGLVLFLVDVSNAAPAAPAQLGTFEIGAYYMLNVLKVHQAGALAFALLFHAQQALPQIVVGVPFAVHFMGWRRRSPRG